MSKTALAYRVMEPQNESEKIFEQYLDSNVFKGKWTHEPSMPGKSKKPDYLLDYNSQKCFFEVKELRKKPKEPTLPAHINPYLSLRTEVNEAREKFREYKEYICSLVVFNIGDSSFRPDPRIVFGAMLGNLGIAADFDIEKGEVIQESKRNVFGDSGKMIDYKGKQSQNTTISAIIVLEKFLDNIEIEKAMRDEEKRHGKKFEGSEWTSIRMKLYKDHPVRNVPRVVVVENPFARKPFPEGLFNGLFDERWRWIKESGEIDRIFVGSKLKELEELKNKS